MADAVAVFPPGFRITDDATGAPLNGAVLTFFDTGTTNPKIVYADQDLTTPLGTSVTTNSVGAPTTNGTTQTLIYVGTASYDVYCVTSGGATVYPFPFINVKGAVVGDAGSSSEAITALFPVVTKSLDYTVVSGDQNKLIAVNCSSGDVILTLPSAVTVGNGWGILVQHAGSANQAVLATVSSQTISEGSKSFGTTFALGLNGEECWLISDGGNWRVTSHTTPFPKVSPIPVIDRVTAAPVSPVEGGYYLVTSAYSTFSTHDIIQYTDNGYVAFTPYTDCGWLAYVQDEDTTYQFQGTAWAVFPIPATTSVAGISQLADAAAMEAKTANRVVTADVQHRHPLMPKFWAFVTVSGGTPTLVSSHNIASITDSGTGQLTLTFTTAFSSANYCVLGNAGSVSNDIWVGTRLAGSVLMRSNTTGGGSANDPSEWHIVGFGDQ